MSIDLSAGFAALERHLHGTECQGACSLTEVEMETKQEPYTDESD